MGTGAHVSEEKLAHLTMSEPILSSWFVYWIGSSFYISETAGMPGGVQAERTGEGYRKQTPCEWLPLSLAAS